MRRPGFEPDGETVLLASLRSAARIGTRVVQIPRNDFAARGLLAATMRRPGFEPGLGPWQGPVIPLHHRRKHYCIARSRI